ncbi:MAG: DUF4395 domain-containing protein [Thiotrichaceae bacterium]|nr:DUF4395 domain-containing protein [Thiotrichaceae bacterium]
MNSLFSFGEKIPKYEMKVLNEREVRASAGILFLFAMIAFLNSWLIGDFTITKIFVVVFLIEFTIRVLINPKYAPLLIISRFFVRNQTVEYVGAPQKRFAWLIGLVLAVVMFYLIVLNNIIGPFNLFVCILCLTLLFFEAAFGICLGCKIYNLFHQQKAQLCPGNACAIKDQAPIQKINPAQWLLVPLFLGLIFLTANSSLIHENTNNIGKNTAINKDCEIPNWVKKIGHEKKWKLHNGCTETGDKVKNKVKQEHQSKPDKDCTVPQFAIDMGHVEKWKLHNGCQ